MQFGYYYAIAQNQRKGPMNVEMIIIGDEILNGRTQESNGHFLAQFLSQKGLHLFKIQIVADKQEEIAKALDLALERSDIIITSGGLGPTQDDRTKNALAQYFKKDLFPKEEVASLVKEHYARIGKEWTPKTNSYHILPKDFQAAYNPQGLAPGLTYFDKSHQKLIMAGPGVPREFSAMLEEAFFPLIKKHFKLSKSQTERFSIRTRGVPEEKIFFELCPNLWEELSQFGKVSSLPQIMGVDIVIAGDDFKNKEKQIRKIVEKTPLKENIWQYGELSLPEYVLKVAREKKLTLATAESCTGGLCASRLTDMPGCSDVFLGSVVSYANEIKMNVLGVKEETLKKYGAVSTQVAQEMASGLQKVTKASFTVSFTGIAGPSGGTEEKPVGTIAIGICNPQGETDAKLFHLRGNRQLLKLRFSELGLFQLLEKLIQV